MILATNGISSTTIKEFLGDVKAPTEGSRNAVRNPLQKWPKIGEFVSIPVQYSKINQKS